MNAQEWNKLKQNWCGLLKDVRAKDLSSYLFKEGKLDPHDKEMIEHAGTEPKQMEKLLEILPTKPLELGVFDALVNALKVDYEWLAVKITESVSKADASICSQEDPHLIDEKVRRALHLHYANKAGETVKLLEIIETLKSEDVFTGHSEWSNEILVQFVKGEFLNVTDEIKEKLNPKHKKPTIILRNIGKIDPSEKTSQSNDVNKMAHKEVKDMNPSELKLFMSPKFETEGFDQKILEDMERESISGKVFMTMKEDDFKATTPNANFGVRRFLKMVIEQNTKICESKPVPQHLCKFDSIVGPTDKYIKGNCADVNTYLRGKTTTPVRNFHLVEDDDKEFELDDMSAKVVTFASACMNDRRNGTIYFGVSPSEKDDYKAGEIVGVSHPREVFQENINAYLTSAFSDIQKNIISGTVRNARFVPVLIDDYSATDAFVVEVDVSPSSAMMAEETIRTELRYLPEFNKKDKSKSAVFRFSDEGHPAIVSPDEMTNYERDKARIIQQRKLDENSSNVKAPPDLRIKLRNLLTGGAEKLDDTSFIFLMMSPIDSHMDQEYLQKSMSFIKNIKPEVVFDFDPKGSSHGIYKNLDSHQEEVMRVLTTDNFEKETKTKEEYNIFIESLEKEKHIPWIFCNGYDELSFEPMTTTDWNRKRRIHFQEALKTYINNVTKDRIIFMICLFSNNCTALIDACDDVLTQLPENFLLLAENDTVANVWQDQILQRQRVDRKIVVDSSVIGMPWEQINITINQTLKEQDFQGCPIPSSFGPLIVPEKKLKDWCDIDFVSARDFNISNERKEQTEKEVEEKFYKGDQVSWLNFCFHDQVLKRDIHKELKKFVIESLKGSGEDEEDTVTAVPILHQPGAGGTTSAKQVLWDLRTEYRCCVVNTITDQTADQLDEIRCFGDPNPKPLLILVDNEDEEDYIRLRQKLEDKGRKFNSGDGESYKVYCTIIICIRHATLPVPSRGIKIVLRQQLSSQELDWFNKKFKTLTKRFKGNEDKNVDPGFLISFNIYKENFNKDFVLNVVKEFSDDVKCDTEINILKILSFLNNHNPFFNPVSLACLDRVLKVPQKFWRNQRSQGFKVLSNLSLDVNQQGKPKMSLSVNKLIANEIFKNIMDKTGQKESEIMLELIESGVCEQWNNDAKKLLKSIVNIMIKRVYDTFGKKYPFSQFIIHVSDNEGVDIAADLMKELFDKTQNPFIAQQISRFFSIKLKNWDRAEHYAQSSTDLQPWNSYFWDTCGQVFKNHLSETLEPANIPETTKGFSGSEIHSLIVLTQNALDCFKKSQDLSKQERGARNFAGYFNELRAIEQLLSALKLCPELAKDDNLHRYLVDEHYQLSDINDKDSDFLKSLEKIVTETVKSIDEQLLLTVKRDDGYPIGKKNDEEDLLDIRLKLDDYFEASTDNIPQYLDKNGACQYRLRRARKLGATSLHKLLRMKKDGQLDLLKQIYDLLIENVNSRIKFDDLRSILDTVTVYMLDNSSLPRLEYKQVLEWCKKLYSLKCSTTNTRSLKDAYFYYVLYNFPTDERSEFDICKPDDLITAMSLWSKDFAQNNDKDIFCLAKGSPLRDIVHHGSIEALNNSLLNKSQHSEFQSQLLSHVGTLLHEGIKIKHTIITKEGNKFDITIPTFQQITKRDYWQKRIYFFIGFSFSGPRAFGISVDSIVPSNTVYKTPSDLTATSTRNVNHDVTQCGYQNFSCPPPNWVGDYRPPNRHQNQTAHLRGSSQNQLYQTPNIHQNRIRLPPNSSQIHPFPQPYYPNNQGFRQPHSHRNQFRPPRN